MNDNNKYLWMVMAGVLFVIGIEYLIARHKGLRVFRLQNTIVNLSMGIFDRVAGLLMVPLIYMHFNFLYTHFAIFDIPETKYYFVFAVIVSDFLWYFYHRAGHQINLFWGAHIIHHQSEDYNYTVALNLTPFQVIIRILVWSLMPIIGFSAEVVLATHLVIGLYQFLLHTTLISKLGIIEKFMVTPSHHRVHHGSNVEYLDKNYGGIFIIWDRLFGTFQVEKNPVSYGVTKDINTRNFIPSVFHYYSNLWFQIKQLPTITEKIKLLFKGPDWIPESGALKLSNTYIDKGSYDYKNYSKSKTFYLVFSMIFTFIILAITAYIMADTPRLYVYALLSFIMLNLVVLGRLIENKSVLILEIIKYIGLFFIFYKLYL